MEKKLLEVIKTIQTTTGYGEVRIVILKGEIVQVQQTITFKPPDIKSP
jgi:hypothetical protein